MVSALLQGNKGRRPAGVRRRCGREIAVERVLDKRLSHLVGRDRKSLHGATLDSLSLSFALRSAPLQSLTRGRLPALALVEDLSTKSQAA